MSTGLIVKLRGGHRLQFSLENDSSLLPRLRRIANKQPPEAGKELLQIPLDTGHECLSVNTCDVAEVRIPGRGEHPTMNTSEGHLGGYISARHPQSAETGMQNGDSATWSPRLWRWLVNELGVTSVLDVGCGEGHAAGFFAELGCRIRGVDGSQLALRDTVIPGQHVLHDYTHGPYQPEQPFDLVWSCEFVEHVEEQYVEHFLSTFDSASQYLLITAAPPGQVGWHHVNCQPAEYWIERIEQRGFSYSEALTCQARALAAGGHFNSQGLVFVRPTHQDAA